MTQPWKVIDTAPTPDGSFELRQRGDRDFLITINNRVLMNSRAGRSEIVLGAHACRELPARSRPRVLIGGIGMGLTLRAALDVLPDDARVVVAELNPAVVAWCRGPLGELTNRAVEDPRVTLAIDDVANVIALAAGRNAQKFDAIIIDLYEGPGSGTDPLHDPFYGVRALKITASALASDGIFAVWGENPDAGFEKRLAAAGFSVDRQRPGRGGLRHVVYIAKKIV